jgi:hypothetical protein
MMRDRLLMSMVCIVAQPQTNTASTAIRMVIVNEFRFTVPPV